MKFPEYKIEYDTDREMLMKECLPALKVYEKEIKDFHEFFFEKNVQMMGFGNTDRSQLRKFVVILNSATL